jgi:hypothetical protein
MLQQRGRKTIGHRAGIAVNGDPPRLEPPSCLSKPERRLFAEIVAVAPAQQFVASDAPLLASYVQACLLARSAVRRAGKDARALSTWEKASRVQAMLATRLRLSPHSRVDPKVIGRHQPQQRLSAYEQMRLDDAGAE